MTKRQRKNFEKYKQSIRENMQYADFDLDEEIEGIEAKMNAAAILSDFDLYDYYYEILKWIKYDRLVNLGFINLN